MTPQHRRHRALTITGLALWGGMAPAAPPADEPSPVDEIVVRAPRSRDEALADTPTAVTVVDGALLRRSGAFDIRGLNGLAPSLLVSSSSTEAVGAAARIRGIGTVGDNPGLEGSVSTYVDGVYRPRTGVALTELGGVDRIEVLRGPQGTLFGRNASAGVIAVTTDLPSFDWSADAAATIGNRGTRRLEAAIGGPLTDRLAARLDAVRYRQHGLVEDVNSGRDLNDRDRWLLRGQLLFRPAADWTVRLIGDWSRRDEECCAGVYLPLADRVPADGGGVEERPSTYAALIERLGGAVPFDPDRRLAAVTPGRSFRSDVEDGGLSAQIDAPIGRARLTAITAMRDWHLVRGQDGDFGSLDLLKRDDDGGAGERLGFASQEVRLGGTALGGRLDWLVGGYGALERLRLTDNFQYGADFGRFYACAVAGQIGTADPASPGCLAPASRAAIAEGSAAGVPVLAALDRLGAIAGGGILRDRFVQHGRNLALFTQEVLALGHGVSLTLGARYTHERKRLDADLAGDPASASVCLANGAAMAPVRGDPSLPAAIRGAAGSLAGFPCILSPIVSARLDDRRSDGRLTGTAIASWAVRPGVLAYASWASGYKAGGYNLDRASLAVAAPDATALRFAPERTQAFELGLKLESGGASLFLTGFLERVRNFQLNAFNGSTFTVETIEGCGRLDGGAAADGDNLAASGACLGAARPGVIARGVEVEGHLRPAPAVVLTAAATDASTRYADDLAGEGGRPLGTGFFQLPSRRLTSAPAWAATGSLAWTPALGGGWEALVHADGRYTSRIDTGADLDLEKRQEGFFLLNARLGLTVPGGRWSAELWARNLTGERYLQVGYDAPGQPGGTFNTTRGVLSGYQARSTQLYGAFLGEPRLWGLTVRGRI
jgi:iron complex outermembrane recepter protein